MITAKLEDLDKLETSLMFRRDRALRCISEYRDSLARRIRQTSDRVIEGNVLALDDTSSPPITGQTDDL